MPQDRYSSPTEMEHFPVTKGVAANTIFSFSPSLEIL